MAERINQGEAVPLHPNPCWRRRIVAGSGSGSNSFGICFNNGAANVVSSSHSVANNWCVMYILFISSIVLTVKGSFTLSELRETISCSKAMY